MYVLFETPAGFALFKVVKDSKLKDIENLHEEFATESKAKSS
jgi:nucleolar protein 58